MQGYVQLYTGNGKGKTTAALGLALRAAGAGRSVFIAQFIKGQEYSEIKALKRFGDLIQLQQYGTGCFIYQKPTEEDTAAARRGLMELKGIVASGQHDIVILDEANIAVYYGLFSADELLELIAMKHGRVELIITGRYADEKIVARADLVTEMREIKHYYTKGIQARDGIEK